MRAVFQSVVLADWGQTEMSGEDWSYDDVVEDTHPFRAADRTQIHRGGRLVGLGFTSAREHASYAAASNVLHRHVRSDMPRSAGDLTVQTRNAAGALVTTTTITDAVVRITGTRRVGVTTFVSYAARGTLTANPAEQTG
ncbi:MAG: hypothetical protein ACRDJ9_30535 [Dehalococcoidia bacterium]